MSSTPPPPPSSSPSSSEDKVTNEEQLNRLLNQSFNDFLKISEKKEQKKEPETEKEQQEGATGAAKSFEPETKKKSEEDEKFEKKLLDQFEKISSSCGQMYNGVNENDFAEQLKAMEELGKKLESAPVEEMDSIWNQLLTSQPELNQNLQQEAPGMEKMFFDMFFLGMKPLFNQLKEKLPEWVNKNKSDLSDTDIERYEKQIVLVNQMCFEMNAHVEGSPTDNIVQKMHDITKQLEQLGSLPKEVLGVEDLPLFNQMAGPEMPKDCCLM